MIEIRNLEFSYSNREDKCINEISFALRNGEITSVIGENGSGKTTLLRLISGIIPLKYGEVLIDGINAKELKRIDKAKKLSYFPQGRDILDITAYEMVLLGRFPYMRGSFKVSREDELYAMSAMEITDTLKFSERNISSLSYGERQRVYFAMQIAQNADNLLFDEPTNFMDVSARYDMLRLFRKLKEENKCILAVLHDIPLALEVSDRIIIMKNGKIYADETPQKIVEDGKIKEAFGVDVISVVNESKAVYALIESENK